MALSDKLIFIKQILNILVRLVDFILGSKEGVDTNA